MIIKFSFLLFFVFSCFRVVATTNDVKVKEIEELLARESNDAKKIKLIIKLADIADKDANYQLAILHFHKALNLCEKLNDVKQQTSVYNQLGYANIKLNDFNNASAYLDSAYKLAEQINYKRGKAQSIRFRALIRVYEGNYEKATNLYLEALKLWEENGEKDGIGTGYADLGIVYYYRGMFEKTVDYWEKSLSIDIELKDKLGISSQYNNLGLVYIEQKKYDKAEDYFKNALQINNELSNKHSIADNYNNLGKLEYSKNNLEEAISYMLKAIKIQEDIDDLRGIANGYCNLSEMYRKIGDLKKALAIGKSGLILSKKLNEMDYLKNSYNNLAAIYADMNDYEKAYENRLLHDSISAVLLNEENSKQMIEMETKYQTDKKEKQIEIQNLSLGTQQLELNKRKLIIYFAFVGLALVIALAYSIFRNLQKNKRKNEIISAQKLEVEKQKHIIEEKHKEITDSIKYAQRLQEAIMPPEKFVKEILPESFVLFKPKDVVSGDFYWVEEKDNRIYFAAADCTGHGVPGAFMSIVNYNLLKHSINEHGKKLPSDILQQVNLGLSLSLRQEYNVSTIKDGMDISLCCFDKTTNTLEYAGANNSIYVVSGNSEEELGIRGTNSETPQALHPNSYSLKEYKADKQPIGTFVGEEFKPFTNKLIDVKKGDMVFLFTDGYADQFGGPKGKKLMYKKFEEMLRANSHLSIEEQKNIYTKTIDDWKGNIEQVDDILLIGVRI